jgi:hypothetical protein
VVHLSRGVVGLGAIAGALWLAPVTLSGAGAFFVVGLVALRDCPMCWTFGSLEHVAAKLSGSDAVDACVDGFCHVSRRT